MKRALALLAAAAFATPAAAADITGIWATGSEGGRVVGERRGEMFERAGRGELLDRRAALDPGDRPARAILGRCDVEAGILGLAVEHDMFAAVHRFLIEEIVDLAAQRLRRALAIMAHRRHEEFLADREGRGQRVEKGGAAGIAAVPPARRRRLAPEFEIALFDSDVVGGAEESGHRATFLPSKLH